MVPMRARHVVLGDLDLVLDRLARLGDPKNVVAVGIVPGDMQAMSVQVRVVEAADGVHVHEVAGILEGRVARLLADGAFGQLVFILDFQELPRLDPDRRPWHRAVRPSVEPTPEPRRRQEGLLQCELVGRFQHLRLRQLLACLCSRPRRLNLIWGGDSVGSGPRDIVRCLFPGDLQHRTLLRVENAAVAVVCRTRESDRPHNEGNARQLSHSHRVAQ
mmetsp:Transcript_65892/g.190087  ORF Transcript_65892/g.190087 Transcript_65892/m.190087 type:complete len:217 (+) Transcript_65892:1467-2117(+)